MLETQLSLWVCWNLYKVKAHVSDGGLDIGLFHAALLVTIAELFNDGSKRFFLPSWSLINQTCWLLSVRWTIRQKLSALFVLYFNGSQLFCAKTTKISNTQMIRLLKLNERKSTIYLNFNHDTF